MTQPLREDFPIYDLPSEKVIDGPWPPAPLPPYDIAKAIAKLEPEAPAKKKPGRKPGSKNKPKRAKKAKAPAAEVPAAVPETAPIQSQRVAAGGEGMLSRVRRITADQWVWILIPVAAIALAVALAFLTGAVKL